MSTPTQPFNALTHAEATLPAAWYYDRDHHARELQQIWERSWIYVCRAEDLADPLTYRTIEIGTQNIVVLRDQDGSLKAFHNACRHRGSMLCQGREGRLSRLIVCPYHQWSYAPDDGRLVKTSSFADPEGFEKSDYGLFRVAVADWRGCIFIHLNPEAVFDPQIVFNRPPDNLANFPLEEMRIGHRWASEIACNWKTFWENFNECLHCPNIHPELVDLVPMFQRRIINPMDVPGWEDLPEDGARTRGGMKDGAETWSSDASAQGRLIPELTEVDHARGHTYATALPSIFVAGYPDHIRIVRLRPLGPERTEISAEWLFPEATLEDPDYDRAKVVDFGILIMDQDAKACELNQQGLHARPFDKGVLMPEEYLLKRFQDWVRATLDAS